MKIFILIMCVLMVSVSLKGQFFGKKSMGISQGAIFFNSPSLNNRNNANNKTSWITEADKNLFLSRFFTFNLGGGVGNYKNPDNRFETYQSTNFYRVKFALMLHLPSMDKCKDCHDEPNLISPFFQVGYNFDILNNAFKAIGSNRVNVNMKVGGGIAVKITKEVGILYGFTLNQRVNPDYRTFYQHNIGLLVNLQKDL